MGRMKEDCTAPGGDKDPNEKRVWKEYDERKQKAIREGKYPLNCRERDSNRHRKVKVVRKEKVSRIGHNTIRKEKKGNQDWNGKAGKGSNARGARIAAAIIDTNTLPKGGLDSWANVWL